MTGPNLIAFSGNNSASISVDRKVKITNENGQEFTISPNDKAVPYGNGKNIIAKNNIGFKPSGYNVFNEICGSDKKAEDLTMQDLLSFKNNKNIQIDFDSDFEQTGKATVKYKYLENAVTGKMGTREIKFDFETDAEMKAAKEAEEANKKTTPNPEQKQEEPGFITKAIAKFLDFVGCPGW